MIDDEDRRVRAVGVGEPDASDALDGVDGVAYTHVDGPDDALAAVEDATAACVLLAPDGADWDPVVLVERLADCEPPVPVILRSAEGLDAYADAGLVGAIAAVVAPDDTDGLLEAVTDAVETVRRRARNREGVARYRSLVEGSPVPVAVLGADGEVRSANDAMASLLAADDPADLLGRSTMQFVATAAEETSRERLRRVVEDRESTPAAQRTLVGADGEEKYVISSMQPVEFGGDPTAQVVLTNVTEHKRLEAALREERDRFSTLFESLSEPVVATAFAGETPVVTEVNEAFAETFGVDPEAAVGQPLDALIVPPEERESAHSFNRRAREGERLEVEVRRRTPDGPRDFLLRYVPYERDDDLGGFAIYIDVTERREWERQLRRQNERLEEVARVVSHDLRNPLNVAAGTAQTLARDADDREAFTRIERAHDRMEAIIDDMLALARQGQSVSDLSPVDLAAVAREAWATVETGDATLDVHTASTVMADRSRLQGALENLFANAVTHGGPTVTVTVGDMPDCPVDPDDETDRPRLRGGFFVADDGPGIPADARDEVFDSGYSTGEDSTGFGLSIVQSIVEAHGWEVRVADRPDGESGACFEVVGVEYAGERGERDPTDANSHTDDPSGEA